MASDDRTSVAGAGDARRPLVVVGLKAYFGQRQTLDWFTGLEGLVATGRAAGVDLVVIPVVTAIAVLAERARAVGVVLGAQDCSWAPPGAYTGEVPACLLAEVGARVVEVGHVERRTLFGESDEVVRRKTRAAVDAGLTPFVCVGEANRAAAPDAATCAVAQAADAVRGVPDGVPVIVAYEPAWAVGAAEPAPAIHVGAVCRRLRAWAADRGPGTRVLYGGTAGPGLFGAVAADLDGLALGRRAHDLAALGLVLDEVRSACRAPERGE